MGLFHHRYYLDGRLIAVGVMDHLPRYLSSVYLYYDPDMNFLSMGVYTALKEIEYAQAHGYSHYVLGLYVETCAKMRYKRQFEPSEILLPSPVADAALAAEAMDPARAVGAPPSRSERVAAHSADVLHFTWVEVPAALRPLVDRSLYRANAPERHGYPAVAPGRYLAACNVVNDDREVVLLGRLVPYVLNPNDPWHKSAAAHNSNMGQVLTSTLEVYGLFGISIALRIIMKSII